jgi:predicted nucleotidyltransferase
MPRARVWLFGSRARRTNGPRADYDFAIETDGPADNAAWSRFWNEVDEHAPTLCAIDLVDLASASDELRRAVRAEGIPL